MALSAYDKQQYRDYEHCKRVLRDIFSRTRIYKLSHDKMIGLVNTELYESKAYGRLSQYLQGKLSGYFDANYDHITRYELEFKHCINGNWYNLKNVDYIPGYENDSKWIVATNYSTDTAHFWLDTDRMF